MDRASQQLLRPFQPTAAPRKPEFNSAFVQVKNATVRMHLEELLLEPANELRSRPSHQFRAHLVNIGAELAGDTFRDDAALQICANAIEYLHLGSLIVDDIQDGSSVRRNGPTLHESLGLAHALSVGNWLYFRALRLIEQLDVDDVTRQMLCKEWHEAMELAHYGQAMDLSLAIDGLKLDSLQDICYHCSLYKTGSIVALAMTMGALVSGASAEKTAAIKELGYALGVYLQQLNDLGNISGDFDQEKHFEDLSSLKPSFLWSFVMAEQGKTGIETLLQAVKTLPDTTEVLQWLKINRPLTAAKAMADNLFNQSLSEFRNRVPGSDLNSLIKLKHRIEQAYA